MMPFDNIYMDKAGEKGRNSGTFTSLWGPRKHGSGP